MHSIPSRSCQGKASATEQQEACTDRQCEGRLPPTRHSAQPQNVCKKPTAGNCQQLNCITELIPPVPRPRPQDELGETNSPVEQLWRGHLLHFCSVKESYKLHHNPLGRFLSYLSPGSHRNTRAEGSIAGPYSPHTARCRKGHATFPLGVCPLYHSPQFCCR